MKELLIIRKQKTDGQGVFGTAFAYPTQESSDVDFTWDSGELKWTDLDHNGVRDTSVSCIPQGSFLAKKTYSHKRSTPEKPVYVYELQNVPGAVAVQLHPANFFGDVSRGFVAQVEGCIGLGKGRGLLQNEKGNMQEAILNSKEAIKEFDDWANGEDIMVRITEQFPGVGEESPEAGQQTGG